MRVTVRVESYIYVRARTPHGESGCVDVVLSRTQYMYHSTALCRDGVVVARRRRVGPHRHASP